MTTVLTDKKVINNIFKALRKEGYIARQSYMCCDGCAWAKMESEYNADENSKIVFYHQQDAESFSKSKTTLEHTLYLAWQGNGEKIQKIIEEHGFEADWDGNSNMKIGIKPKREQE